MAWQHRTVAQELQIVALSRDHPQRRIAELVGVSAWTVHDVQRKYHVVLRFGRSISSAQFRYAYDEHVWGRIIETLYHEQRLPLEEVARRCGVAVGTIRRRMDDLGLRRRTSGETRRGRARGPYRWSVELPQCETDGCTTRVRVEDETRCARCRRSARRRVGL